jgi:hypothetical protein
MITNKKYPNRSVLKYCSSISAFILLVLLSSKISGQAQTNFLETLTDKFQKYCSSFPREEIYVHTDRQEYVAGEDLWFKIYLIDRKSTKPSSDSKIAYFEILNAENRPVVQKRIKLDRGFGPGQILLPDTIRSGNYTLRAYTNWMKNFMPYNCFSKTLKIYNALNGKSFNENSKSLSATSKPGKRDMSTGQTESEFKVDINNNKQESVELLISASQNYRSLYGNSCFLFVQTHGVINYKSFVGLSGDISRIEIPRNQLIPGINHITLFNASGKPVKEQFIYTPMKETNSLTIVSPDSFKSRDKILVGVDIGNKSASEADSPDFSISVAPAGNNMFPDIDDYMIFGSEFGVLPDEILTSDLDDIPANAFDSILSRIKSNWINWNTILSGNFPLLKYRKEAENHFIYGRLINRNSQVPDGDQYLFLSMPGKNATFQYAKTDESGNFVFTILLDNKIKDLIIQPEETNRNNIIKIETSFSEKYPEFVPVKDNSAGRLTQDVSKLGINYQVMKIYRSDEITEKSAPLVFTGGSQRFYGKPDIELIMDDYIKLPVMQEVFFELLPGVFLKKKKAEYEITIADPVENRVYDKPPLLLIDGVVIKDPAVIANLDPELVEKIDAVKSRYFIGEYMFYGLVNVITRAGDFSNVTLPDYAVRLPYRITEPVSIFSSPDYSLQEKRQSRIPDFRNTLYWNSSVEPDKDGRASVGFWCSDIDSEYEISIQGFTGTGMPVSAKKNFRLLRRSDP